MCAHQIMFICVFLFLIFERVSLKKDSQTSAKIAELDDSICEGIKEPVKGGAKNLLSDVKLFNTLFRKVAKAVFATKDQELNHKKAEVAEVVVKYHPHFLRILIDEEKLKNEGEWEENDLKSLKNLFVAAQEMRNKLRNALQSFKKTHVGYVN
jgi:hypothetical protein